MKIRFDRLIIVSSAFIMAISTATAQQQDDQTAQQEPRAGQDIEEEYIDGRQPPEAGTAAATELGDKSLQEVAEQTPEQLKGSKLYSSQDEELGEIQSIVRHSESGELHALIARGESAELVQEFAVPLRELTRQNDRIVFSTEEDASQALQEWSYDESQFEEISSPA